MKKVSTHIGYETFINSLKISLRMMAHLFILAFVLHMLFCCITIYMMMDMMDISIMFEWFFAYLIDSLNITLHLKFHYPDGQRVRAGTDIFSHSPSITAFAIASINKIKRIVGYTSIVYLILPAFIKFFRYWAQKSENYVRGSKLLSIPTLLKEMKKRNEVLDLPFGSVKMPVSAEPKSTLIVGSPGVGKTVMIGPIFHRLIDREERVVIYDYKGDYLEKFYTPERGDKVFNPLDARCLGYNIFNDINQYPDIDAIATSLIPPSATNSDPYWNDAARDVFSSILHYLNRNAFRNNKEIWRMITSTGEAIKAALQATPGGERGLRHLEDPTSKMTQSVLSVMTGYCRCFEYLTGINGEFSIKEWIETGKGCLFITSNAAVEDSLRPILSLFIDLLARKLLSMPDTTDQKTFFLLDEFASLQQLYSVSKLFTVGRSKGGSCIIGVQDFGQIDKIYSKEHRATIINACGNKVIFSVKDANTAKYCSALLGDEERLYSAKSLSMGDSIFKNKANLNFKKHREPLFLPSTIMDMPDLQCLVKFSSYSPVISNLTYRHYETRATGFEIREDLLLNYESDISWKI
jgi:type IV secretory pathway TraG/TraD family ATPase VirD4